MGAAPGCGCRCDRPTRYAELSRLERATYDEAVAAEARTPIQPHEPMLPMCFVYGPERAAGDGLVAPEFVWSALECPTGYVWSYDQATGRYNGATVLLGRLSAHIDGRPRPGERCVVTSWQSARENRRLTAEAALFGESGNLLAIGRAT